MHLTRVNGLPPTFEFDQYLVEQMTELFPDNLYKLGDQMCKGVFTGDDFCEVSISPLTLRLVSLLYAPELVLRRHICSANCHNYVNCFFALLSGPL